MLLLLHLVYIHLEKEQKSMHPSGSGMIKKCMSKMETVNLSTLLLGITEVISCYKIVRMTVEMLQPPLD